MLPHDSPVEETETESNVWDDGLVDVNPFGRGNPSFQKEPIVLVEEESCPVYNTDNEKEESLPVYDTDIEDVVEEEKGFVGKGGFGREEDNIEDVVVVDNDLCPSMIQTILIVDFDNTLVLDNSNRMHKEAENQGDIDITLVHNFLKLKGGTVTIRGGRKIDEEVYISKEHACDPIKVIAELAKGELLVFFPKDTAFTSFFKGKVKKGESFTLQHDSPVEEMKTETNDWDDGLVDVNSFGRGNPGFQEDYYDNPLLTKETESEPIIRDIGDEEEEYAFVNKYLSFQEEPILLVKDESCPVYNTDSEEEESLAVFDTDIEDVIEEEKDLLRNEDLVGKKTT
uniref:Uncharacterized protein n=1 Tax=Tanacetum cinerariifolium TaxID=118510 RepID=A0A699GMP9_TANCI|nr:hypothetical protein [Tanacetum cinerariifolium]